MRSKLFLASGCAVAALAASSPAAAALSDFRLPAETSQPQPETSPEPTSPPVEVPTMLLAPTGEAPLRRDPSAASTPGSGFAAQAAAPSPEPAPAADPTPVPARAPQPAGGPVVGETHRTAWSWLWLLGTIPLLLGAGWAARRAFRRPPARSATPEVERPRPAQAAPAPPQADPLQVSLEPLRLALTLMNATLAYRLEIANRGDAPLRGLTIGADMISAHASLSREEQLSGPQEVGGAPTHRIGRLEPGESRLLEGEFRLPFPQIVPIRQGNAALLVPLARLRVDAEGAEPLVRTFAIGQPGEGNALQPFRLDHGPRIYPRLAQHAFA